MADNSKSKLEYCQVYNGYIDRCGRPNSRQWANATAPMAIPRYALADLLAGMTPEAMHEAFDWGPDRGCEQGD